MALLLIENTCSRIPVSSAFGAWREHIVTGAPTILASGGGNDPLGGNGDHAGDDGGGTGTGSQTATRPKTLIRSPSMYKVVLLNDDFTPMDFVVHVLQKFFKKEYNEATRIMLQVHQKGAGVAGVFSYEIAETKVFQVNQYSKQNQYPLKSTMEKA